MQAIALAIALAIASVIDAHGTLDFLRLGTIELCLSFAADCRNLQSILRLKGHDRLSNRPV